MRRAARVLARLAHISMEVNQAESAAERRLKWGEVLSRRRFPCRRVTTNSVFQCLRVRSRG